MDMFDILNELISVIDSLPAHELPSSTAKIVRARELVRHAHTACQNYMLFSNIIELRETRQKLMTLEQHFSSFVSTSISQHSDIQTLLNEINLNNEKQGKKMSFIETGRVEMEKNNIELEKRISLIETVKMEMKKKMCLIETVKVEVEKMNMELAKRISLMETVMVGAEKKNMELEKRICLMETVKVEAEQKNMELEKRISLMKKKMSSIENKMEKMELERREKESRAIIRAIAVNLEFEIKEAAIYTMRDEDRALFCRGDVTVADVTRATIYDVMDKLDIEQRIRVLSILFGKEASMEHYSRFLDASSYMKEGFLDDAHPTRFDDGTDIMLADALRMVTNAKMEGSRRRRPPSPYTEDELKETIIQMLYHLEDLRRQRHETSLLF